MKLTLPKGYELPDDAQVGEPFEAVATLVANEDGSFQLSAIDGIDLDDAEDSDEDEEPEEVAVIEDPSGVRFPWDEV